MAALIVIVNALRRAYIMDDFEGFYEVFCLSKSMAQQAVVEDVDKEGDDDEGAAAIRKMMYSALDAYKRHGHRCGAILSSAPLLHRMAFDILKDALAHDGVFDTEVCGTEELADVMQRTVKPLFPSNVRAWDLTRVVWDDRLLMLLLKFDVEYIRSLAHVPYPHCAFLEQ
jgi:hypothetical protein